MSRYSTRWIVTTLFGVLLLGCGTVSPATAAETIARNPDRGETVTICHNLSTDSGPKTERVIDETAWDTHVAHGDSRGSCSGFVRVNLYSARDLQDFYVSGDTTLQYLHTGGSLRVYRNDTVLRTVEADSTDTIRLSKNSTIRAVRCDDRSTGFDDETRRSLECHLFDSDGDKTDTTYFPNHSHATALLGERLLVSERGEPQLYDFEGDTTVWNLTGKVWELHPGDAYRYFLSVHTEGFRSIHELRELETGRLISSREERAFHREIGREGSYLYLVESDPTSRTKTLTVYDRQFERVARWEKLPFHGEYDGSFSLKRDEVYVPLRNGKLLVGDLDSGKRRMKPYPGPGFTPSNVQLDRSTGHLFLYGIMVNDEGASFLTSNRSRRLIVYDSRSGEFLPDEVVFSSGNYNFDSNIATTRLRLLQESHLAVQHPNRLEIYQYEFD